jgi:hypothetical protein
MMPENITHAIAEAERATVNAAAALLDVQVDLAIARQHVRELKRQLAAGADLRVDDAETTRSDLAFAYLEMAQLATLLMSGADRLTAVLSTIQPPKPKDQPAQP